MTVSKRLRYEVLRRDNHLCRYCGATAPDVPLRVDHVLPVALGGTDDPSNLVAACQDCNAGKAASNPDQPLVETVSDDALRWARAVALAVQEALEDRQALEQNRHEFYHAWSSWKYGREDDRKTVPLAPDWENTVDIMVARGLPMELLLESIRIAMNNDRVGPDVTFRYFCGVAWRTLDNIQARATTLLKPVDEEQPADGCPSCLGKFLRGYTAGAERHRSECALPAFTALKLSHVVDAAGRAEMGLAT